MAAFTARRLQRTARALRSIGDLSDYLSGMCRVLHRHRLRLEATTPAYQLPAAVAAFRAAIESEIERQEIERNAMVSQAALLMFHADGDAQELIRLVRSRFPALTLPEIGMAAREMKAIATVRRDHLRSEIEAGRYAGRKEVLQ